MENDNNTIVIDIVNSLKGKTYAQAIGILERVKMEIEVCYTLS